MVLANFSAHRDERTAKRRNAFTNIYCRRRHKNSGFNFPTVVRFSCLRKFGCNFRDVTV